MTVSEIELDHLHIEALAAHLYKRSVAILHHNENDKPTDVSSGTCVTIAGRHFVATAGHVVKDVPIVNGTPFYRHFGIAALGKVGLFSHATPSVIACGWRDDDEADVGWLEIDPRAIESWTAEWERVFVPLSRFSLDPVTDKQALMLVGQPGSLVKNQTRFVGLNPQPYLADVINDPDGDHPNDIHIVYETTMQTRGGVMAAPSAKGLSGSGMWRVTKRTSSLWTPDHARLVGTQYAWSKFGEYSSSGSANLRGSPIRYWLDLIKTDVPALATEIDAP